MRLFGKNGKNPPSTQDMLFIRELTPSGVAIMADGTLSRLIKVGPIDMSTLDPNERERIYAWYTDWIRNLHHPTSIQIVSATAPQDISPWLERLNAQREHWNAMSEQAPPQGRDRNIPPQGRDQAELDKEPGRVKFAQRMVLALERQILFIEEAHGRVRPLVDRYYVVVFYNPFQVRGKRSTLDLETFKKAEAELNRRVRRIADGLSRIGLPIAVLDAHQVAAVIGDFYHRQLSPAGLGEAPRLRLGSSLATGLGAETESFASWEGNNGKDFV